MYAVCIELKGLKTTHITRGTIRSTATESSAVARTYAAFITGCQARRPATIHFQFRFLSFLLCATGAVIIYKTHFRKRSKRKIKGCGMTLCGGRRFGLAEGIVRAQFICVSAPWVNACDLIWWIFLSPFDSHPMAVCWSMQFGAEARWDDGGPPSPPTTKRRRWSIVNYN